MSMMLDGSSAQEAQLAESAGSAVVCGSGAGTAVGGEGGGGGGANSIDTQRNYCLRETVVVVGSGLPPPARCSGQSHPSTDSSRYGSSLPPSHHLLPPSLPSPHSLGDSPVDLSNGNKLASFSSSNKHPSFPSPSPSPSPTLTSSTIASSFSVGCPASSAAPPTCGIRGLISVDRSQYSSSDMIHFDGMQVGFPSSGAVRGGTGHSSATWTSSRRVADIAGKERDVRGVDHSQDQEMPGASLCAISPADSSNKIIQEMQALQGEVRAQREETLALRLQIKELCDLMRSPRFVHSSLSMAAGNPNGTVSGAPGGYGPAITAAAVAGPPNMLSSVTVASSAVAAPPGGIAATGKVVSAHPHPHQHQHQQQQQAGMLTISPAVVAAAMSSASGSGAAAAVMQVPAGSPIGPTALHGAMNTTAGGRNGPSAGSQHPPPLCAVSQQAVHQHHHHHPHHQQGQVLTSQHQQQHQPPPQQQGQMVIMNGNRQQQGAVAVYQMVRTLKTVAEVWREYKVGLQANKPAVEMLELRQKNEEGFKWRDRKESKWFSRQMRIIRAIEGKAKELGDFDKAVSFWQDIVDQEFRGNLGEFREALADQRQQSYKKRRQDGEEGTSTLDGVDDDDGDAVDEQSLQQSERQRKRKMKLQYALQKRQHFGGT